jgi:hypothetical protein
MADCAVSGLDVQAKDSRVAQRVERAPMLSIKSRVRHGNERDRRGVLRGSVIIQHDLKGMHWVCATTAIDLGPVK